MKAIVEIVCRLGLRRLPLLPSHKAMQEMARATAAVYEAEVERLLAIIPIRWTDRYNASVVL